MSSISNKEIVKVVLLRTVPALLIWLALVVFLQNEFKKYGIQIGEKTLALIYMLVSFIIIERFSGKLIRSLLSEKKADGSD